MVYIIPTSPTQDAAAAAVLSAAMSKAVGKISDNCSSYVNDALDAAGIVDAYLPNNIPGSAGQRAAAQGAAAYIVPEGGSFPLPPKLLPFVPPN